MTAPLLPPPEPARWIPALVGYAAGAYLVGIGIAYLIEWVRLCLAS